MFKRNKKHSSYKGQKKKHDDESSEEETPEWVEIKDPQGRMCWKHVKSGLITYGNSFTVPQQGYNPASAQQFLLESPPESPKSYKSSKTSKSSRSEANAAPATSPAHRSAAAPMPPGIPYQGGAPYPTSPAQYPSSPVQYPSSPVQYPSSPVQYPSSPVQHPSSPVHYPVSPVQYVHTPVSPAPYGTSPVAVYPMAPWNVGVTQVNPVAQQVPEYIKKQFAQAEKVRKKKEEDKKRQEMKKREAKGSWTRLYDESEGKYYWKSSVTGRKVDTDPYY